MINLREEDNLDGFKDSNLLSNLFSNNNVTSIFLLIINEILNICSQMCIIMVMIRDYNRILCWLF